MANFFRRRGSAFTLLEETPDKPGFRNCQLGAVWAAKSHFTVSRNHALVNMPTGTGKTGVMIALAFELKARRVFVLAPTRLLRRQTQEKFESMRLLEKLGALRGGLKERPRVLEITTRPKGPAEWRQMLRYDVVVATPHTVSPSYGVKPPAGFFGAGDSEPPAFDLLFVDEAHHSPAATWHAFLKQARDTRVVYLTATPFRRDRRRIRAKPVYGYPISQAMADGIYRPVRFVPVGDPHPARRDVLLARKALELFVEERKVNPAAAVIVKAGTIDHAMRLLETYRKQGWRKLDVIHSKREPGDNQKVIRKVRCGRDDGVDPKDRLDGFISVEMGGEGIDIPNLKIAVFHQAPKTLPYTVQLIGRVSRVEKGQAGEAVLLTDPKLAKGSEVEELYTSDKGWSEMLPGLFKRVVDETRFLPDPDSRITHIVSVDDLNPYLSVKVSRRRGPFPGGFKAIGEKALAFADEHDLEFVVFERRGQTVLVLTRTWEVPGWTRNRAFEYEKYDLHVFHAIGQLLFESTTSEKICAKIRGQVYNPSAYDPLGYQRIRKALSDASGGHYYVLGLRNQSGVASGLPEYKTYLGDDVQAALRTADARAFGAGHAVMKKDDEIRGIAISTSRIWSNKRGPLDEFESWCGRLAKLLGASGQKPIPHVEDKLMGTEKISKYPKGEMPVSIYLADLLLRVRGFQVLLDAEPIDDPVWVFSKWAIDRERIQLDVDLELVEPVTGRSVKTLRLRHQLAGQPFWKLLSKVRVEVNLDPSRSEPDLFTPSLDQFLTSYPPIIVFESGRTLRRNILFTPRIQTQRIDPDDLVEKSWDETDVKKESDPLPAGSKYRYNVLQKTTEIVTAEYGLDDSDLLICDDRAHEVADLVLVRPSRKRLTFFHLKYKVSKGRKPGAARADVTELIDQGIRTGHWIRAANLMKRLKDRVAAGSTIEHGRPSTLAKLAEKFYADQWTYSVVLVQPGIDRLKVIRAKKPTQTEQLLLMLRDRLTADYGASFSMWTDAGDGEKPEAPRTRSPRST